MKRSVLRRTSIMALILVAWVGLYSKVTRSIDQLQTLNLADVQAGLGNAEVKQIQGTGSNFSMRIILENKNDFPVRILCKEGSVIQSKTRTSAGMITLYPQTFVVQPGKVEEFGIETYCIEAWKKPADEAMYTGHVICDNVDNKNLKQLIDTIHHIETDISDKIISIEGDSFTAQPMDDRMVPLAQSSQYSKSKEGDFRVKLNEQIVQFAIWQVTDHVSMDHLSTILHVESEETKEALKLIAQLSNLILEQASLEPAIRF